MMPRKYVCLWSYRQITNPSYSSYMTSNTTWDTGWGYVAGEGAVAQGDGFETPRDAPKSPRSSVLA